MEEEPTYSYVAEDDIDEDLLCGHICFTPLTEPMTHNQCGHSFCQHCIEHANWKCPACRTGTKGDFSKMNARLVLSLLAKIPIRCDVCEKRLQRGDFKDHIPHCPLPCPRGCGETTSRSQLEQHAQVCGNLSMLCLASDVGCTVQVCVKERNE